MSVNGFRASAVAAGLRYKDRLDLGLIFADQIVGRAAVFTQNLCQAAPVLWTKKHVNIGRAILVNVGQANAQTGAEGFADCQVTAECLAEQLDIRRNQVLLASTGIIGQPINRDAMIQAMPKLVTGLSPKGLDDFSKAILTSDTRPKVAEAVGAFNDGTKFKIWGAAKGSGMIAPTMATMLGFILTDANLGKRVMSKMLKEAAEATFNRVTVDGDTSTNDCVLFLASGAAGGPVIESDSQANQFSSALNTVMENLAMMMAKDGEGATRVVEVAVTNAKTRTQAKMAAKTVAESPLVKTAIHGADANWGRVMAALGRSGAIFDPYRVDLYLDDVLWVKNGLANGTDKAATKVMKKRFYKLTIVLKNGYANYEMLTCDFSPQYVEFNSSYRS
ncbi:MAG: bifunctional glutamate N-acetyltransferase/amino-acid acetyltransferase ArgJ [Deltaproteobacteria bacterium]|jgi:glutamate N-acetyltransferase/amino-acid N-acetyltransferase|nr:bifunctional glutamate N-acetyltransferase/amino-acid acetyltransferase ArgJ [Deltaproteobacteria bacterium]